MRDAWRLAVGTLTAIPTPPPGRVDRRNAGLAILLAPLTVLPVIVVVVLLHTAVSDGAVPPFVAAVLAVGATALWSRGLHLDGLADTVDGLAAGDDRERSLAVMRAGDIGPSGVTTVVLVLLLQVGALGSLLPSRRGTALAVAALLASRYALAWGCSRRVPAARHTGLGATVAGSVSDVALAGSGLIVLALGTGVGVLGGAPWYAAPLVVVAACLATAWLLGVAVRRVGGMTGDVLGACIEISLTVALLFGCLTR